jgi:hypothetical protein
VARHGAGFSVNDELKIFADTLFREGVDVLPCGGGVTTAPLRALPVLMKKYGKDKLIRLCMKLLFYTPVENDYPEGSDSVAEGVLYHLADADLLRELITIRQDRSPLLKERDKDDIFEDKATIRMKLLEELISGICGRLQLPYPEGLSALDPQEEAYLFSGE